MLNHTYTSVKNANLVDCGRKQHIPSQPTPLLKENFLGEFRTELDKKKVLAALGIATELSLEWENIKGDIGRSDELMKALDSRTTYTTKIGEFKDKVISIVQGIEELESIVGGEQEDEDAQNQRLTDLEALTKDLIKDLGKVEDSLSNISKVDIAGLEKDLEEITKKVDNITDLIQVSSKNKNALRLEEGETPGLYVQDLSEEVDKATKDIGTLRADVDVVLGSYVTKDALGGGDFNFVNQGDFDGYVSATGKELGDIKKDLANTVKTDGEGKVNILSVNVIKKNNSEGNNIQIKNSFEMKSGIPLDIRFVRENIEELLKLPVERCYPGMGVIVNSLSSLYILRNPETGVAFDQSYVSDINNWKCPEDLVTQAMTRDEYDSLTEINPNVFYYIYEEEFTLTKPPREDDFDSLEEYEEALSIWQNQVIELDQQYMSASWGIEIESLVNSKASTEAVNSLATEILGIKTSIDSLSGGAADGINLSGLNDQVTQNRSKIDDLTKEDGGTIPTLQQNLTDLQKKVSDDYVTKEEITITDDTNVKYIFVRQSAFEAYTREHGDQIKAGVETNKLSTENVTLSGKSLTAIGSSLQFDGNKIALSQEVPAIKLIDSNAFNALEKPDADTYYYVYDTEEPYVLDKDFSTYKESQSKNIVDLSIRITNNQNSIGQLSDLITDEKNTLVSAINELVGKIADLNDRVLSLEGSLNNSEPIG